MNETTLNEVLVLDFEVDISMVVKEEPNNLGCSSDMKNLQSESVFPNNDSNNVNEDEIIRGLEDNSDGLEEDSNSAKNQDSAVSEAGEIVDSSSKEQEKKSGSEAGEIDKEEPFDVEEGEISETVEKKPICRFFIRGRCYYGSQCQFLHVSDKVYKMFHLTTPSYVSKDTIVPSFPPQIPEHPMEEGSSWELGLKTAKVMIQDSIKKRKEDKEFENKKLYISPEIPKSTPVYSREKEFKSKCKTSDGKAIQAEPVKDLTDTRGRKKEQQSTLNKENSKSEYKWVDPWMRSNKDSKMHTSKRKHKKRHFSLSSTSSLDDIDINYKPASKKRLPRKPSSRDSYCRSYSKSRSRSRSSSRTHFSYQNHSSQNSPSNRKPKRRKIRRSSLEKWYKKEVSTARHSRSPSCSSLDSFQSYESSMTISSISCSQTSSCSSSPNEHFSNPTKRSKRSPYSKVADAFPQRQRIAASSIENLQAYIRPAKQKDLILKDTSLKQRDLNLKDASPKHTRVTVPDVKSSIKPVVKQPPKKKNPALNELLRYTNIKPKASSVLSQTSEQQASKLQDLDSSTSDCKGVVSTNPRRNITLNLQTSKLLKQKVPEIQTKQPGASELSNKEIISKKESLLKQLRLVEQAIARKKNSY